MNGQKLFVYAAMDFAYSLGEKSDSTVIAVVGVDALKNRYILDLDRFKTDKILEYVGHIINAYGKWSMKKLRAEVTAAQSVIVRQIKEMLSARGVSLAIEENRPMKDKDERINSVLQPLYEDRRIWHYKGGNCELLEYELKNTRPEHDDIKNAVSDAIEIAVPPMSSTYVNRNVRIPTAIGRFGGAG